MGVSEELVCDTNRLRRKVLFSGKLSDEEKCEETTQSDPDEESISDETDAELGSASDSDTDSNSESESNDEMEVTRKPKSSNMEYKNVLLKGHDPHKDKINLGSETQKKKEKHKGALAEAEGRLLEMMGEDVDDFRNEYEEDGNMHDESSDEVPAKKRKLTGDEVRETQSER